MQVGKSHSFLFHSACIWGLEVYPASLGDGKKAVSANIIPTFTLSLILYPDCSQVLPPGSFITCGSDDTVR
jgi:hypothetical protein